MRFEASATTIARGTIFCWLNRKHNLTMAYLANGFVAIADQCRRGQEMARVIVAERKHSSRADERVPSGGIFILRAPFR